MVYMEMSLQPCSSWRASVCAHAAELFVHELLLSALTWRRTCMTLFMWDNICFVERAPWWEFGWLLCSGRAPSVILSSFVSLSLSFSLCLVTSSGEYDAKHCFVLTSPLQFLTSPSYARQPWRWVLFHYHPTAPPPTHLSLFLSTSLYPVFECSIDW